MNKISKEVLINIEEYVKNNLSQFTYKYDSENNKYLHSKRVAEIVYGKIGDINSLFVIAMLHDIIEKTNINNTQLLELCKMQEIVDSVIKLTNNKLAINEVGRSKYMAIKLNSLSNESLLIKLADRLDNLNMILNLKELDNYKDDKDKVNIDQLISSYFSETYYVMAMLEDKIIEIRDDDEVVGLVNNSVILVIDELYQEIGDILIENKW